MISAHIFSIQDAIPFIFPENGANNPMDGAIGWAPDPPG